MSLDMSFDHSVSSPTRLYVFLGCGGVGKTTLSAAWALSLAQRDYRVALITIDPAKRLAQSLGLDALDGTLKPTLVHPSLWAMMLDREQTSNKLVNRFSSSPDHAQKIFNNKYFKIFSRALAGTQEMMAVYEVYEALENKQFDIVVLDTPPAQHALEFLDVPKRLGAALDGPALRWLIDSESSSSSSSSHWRSRLGGLGGLGKTVALRAFTKVTSAPFIEDLFEFLSLFGGVLRKLRDQGGSLEQLLQTSTSALWIVSALETSPLHASQQLNKALSERGYQVNQWLINRAPRLLVYSQQQKMSLEQLKQEGLQDLEQEIEVELREFKQKLKDVWYQEIKQAQHSLSTLQKFEKEISQYLLIEELPKELSASDRLQQIAQLLINHYLSEHES